MTGSAFKTLGTVGPGGRVELSLPLPPGTAVEVIVFVPGVDDLTNLVAASASATAFWDNPLDDEDWNAPRTG